MQRISQFFKKMSDWLFVGYRLPILIVAAILLATTVTVAIVYSCNKTETTLVSAFVTIKGFGDGVDFENRQIKIEDGDSIKNIFSHKYKNIYESFGKPYVENNEFHNFMGKYKENGRYFQVTIDGKFDSNLDQAYVYGGQTVVIEYK